MIEILWVREQKDQIKKRSIKVKKGSQAKNDYEKLYK